jgi:hypothetical protein
MPVEPQLEAAKPQIARNTGTGSNPEKLNASNCFPDFPKADIDRTHTAGT